MDDKLSVITAPLSRCVPTTALRSGTIRIPFAEEDTEARGRWMEGRKHHSPPKQQSHDWNPLLPHLRA